MTLDELERPFRTLFQNTCIFGAWLQNTWPWMTLNSRFAFCTGMSIALKSAGFRSLATLKLVVNVVGELQTEKNSCSIARFPCDSTAFLFSLPRLNFATSTWPHTLTPGLLSTSWRRKTASKSSSKKFFGLHVYIISTLFPSIRVWLGGVKVRPTASAADLTPAVLLLGDHFGQVVRIRI